MRATFDGDFYSIAMFKLYKYSKTCWFEFNDSRMTRRYKVFCLLGAGRYKYYNTTPRRGTKPFRTFTRFDRHHCITTTVCADRALFRSIAVVKSIDFFRLQSYVRGESTSHRCRRRRRHRLHDVTQDVQIFAFLPKTNNIATSVSRLHIWANTTSRSHISF